MLSTTSPSDRQFLRVQWFKHRICLFKKDHSGKGLWDISVQIQVANHGKRKGGSMTIMGPVVWSTELTATG